LFLKPYFSVSITSIIVGLTLKEVGQIFKHLKVRVS